MSETVRVTKEQARAAAIAAQGLSPANGATIGSTLESSGFLRTLGGIEVYLALRARVPGITRATVDAAVASGEAAVSPAVRGCMYLVAKRDVPLCLSIAAALSASRDAREHEKAGIRKGEVEKVGEGVLAALKKGPLSTDGIKKALPPGLVRSLGDAGKKVGLSSPLPPALRRLEFERKIERVPETSGLDTERYVWRLARAGAKGGGDGDAAARDTRLAEIFLRGAALGRLADFAEWTGLGKKDAKAALERTGAISVAVGGEDGPFLALPSSRGLFESDERDVVAFLGFEDNLLALHGGPAFLVDREHHDIEMPSWGRGSTGGLAAARHMALRTFVADGRIAGVWEFDPDSGEVAVAPFAKLPPKTRARVDALAKETAKFIASDVGHGRSFSLDTEDELRTRVAGIRGMATGTKKKG